MKDKNDDEYKKKLSPMQYYVLREKGTERPFSGKYVYNKEDGIYRCAACGNELFLSNNKFESGTGWPSFDRAIDENSIKKNKDKSHGMTRTEVICAKCESHLGHIFKDGPQQTTKKRFCINSASLDFLPKKKLQKATFGAGCFWGVEEKFRNINGVVLTTVGYEGGAVENPTYEQVCYKNTGHIEVVELEFDPDIISYEELLDLFWKMHDPTSWDRQGLDAGVQYRSVVFYHNEKQRRIAEESKKKKNQEKEYNGRIVTEIKKAEPFYMAEDYHQKYVLKKKSFRNDKTLM